MATVGLAFSNNPTKGAVFPASGIRRDGKKGENHAAGSVLLFVSEPIGAVEFRPFRVSHGEPIRRV
jgi:hypothetical protein